MKSISLTNQIRDKKEVSKSLATCNDKKGQEEIICLANYNRCYRLSKCTLKAYRAV